MSTNNGIPYPNFPATPKPKPTIIIISGKIASGKSTLAKAICDISPMYKRLALADELKNRQATACGVTREHMELHKDLYRPLLQYYGTDIMRAEWGPDYWYLDLLMQIAGGGITHVVVDDARFPNELEGLVRGAANAITVRLEISPQLQAQRYYAKEHKPLDEAKRLHISETALDNYRGFDMLFDAEDGWAADVLARKALDAIKNRTIINSGIPV